MSEALSSKSRYTPSTSVRKMTFSLPSAAAISTATTSALML